MECDLTPWPLVHSACSEAMRVWGRGPQSENLFLFPALDCSRTRLCVMLRGLRSLWRAVAPSRPCECTHTCAGVCVALEIQFFTHANRGLWTKHQKVEMDIQINTTGARHRLWIPMKLETSACAGWRKHCFV